jgi:hypothetical protein
MSPRRSVDPILLEVLRSRLEAYLHGVIDGRGVAR